MNEDKIPGLNQLKAKAASAAKQISRYKVVLFLLFVILIYGFVWLKASNYTTAQPSSQQVNNLVQASSLPHIDPKVLQQIQNLQDNSVNVQALFNQARSNPFAD